MSRRQEKVESLLQMAIAGFLNEQAGTKSIITVTHCDVSSDLKKATAFITVLPDEYEKEALDFAKRKRADIREHIKKRLKMKSLPFIDVALDLGEKNRQKIEGLMTKI